MESAITKRARWLGRFALRLSLILAVSSSALVFAQEERAPIDPGAAEFSEQQGQGLPAEIPQAENLDELNNELLPGAENLGALNEEPALDSSRPASTAHSRAASNRTKAARAQTQKNASPLEGPAIAALPQSTVVSPLGINFAKTSDQIPAQRDASASASLNAAASKTQAGQAHSTNDEARLSAAFDGLQYPAARRDESVVDDYFGTTVADPYRWLEDANSEETKAFVAEQNKVSEKFLAAIPERDALAKRLDQIWTYQRFSIPHKRGGRWFFSIDGFLYKAQHLYAKRKLVLDPTTVSNDEAAAVSDTSFSPGGRYVAYGVSIAGSDWTTWKVRNVETGRDLPDVIEWTKFFGITWAKGGKGFYYTRFPKPKAGEELTALNENAKVYYHALGTNQKDDILVYERPDHPEWRFAPELTKDGRYLLLESGSPEQLWVKDLSKPDSEFKPLFNASMNDTYSFVGNDGDRFYIRTTKDAPRGKLMIVDLNRPAAENWETVIPEAVGRDVLVRVNRAGERFIAVWSHDVHHVMKVYGPRGDFQYEVKLPEIGSIDSVGVQNRKFAFFKFESFTYPPTNFRLNLETGRYRAYRRPKVAFTAGKFEAKQVFYPSKDGTVIPMFIVYKKGLKFNGKNPTYLTAYGSHGISKTPAFNSSNIAWLERGGIFALANIRGGGEYGRKWFEAGRLKNKQNSIDDFNAAAEYLIREKYTATPWLGAGGGSSGGMLVAAAMAQRPDLFGAVVTDVGTMDLLRFHRFTIGQNLVKTYGTSETKEGFQTLIKISPLQNIKPGPYPATMVMTSDHDDRVPPLHSEKFAATLQAAQTGSAPILARIQHNAGHGGGQPLDVIVQKAADKWAFLLHELGLSRQ